MFNDVISINYSFEPHFSSDVRSSSPLARSPVQIYPKREKNSLLCISDSIVIHLNVIRFHATDLSILREMELTNCRFRFISTLASYTKDVGGIFEI